MVQHAHQSLLAVIAAVPAAVFALTMSPLFVVLMSVCTLSCVAHLIGWMVFVRINLSSISLVPLLLSVGLASTIARTLHMHSWRRSTWWNAR